MSSEPVCVYVPLNAFDAQVILDLLLQEGLNASLLNRIASSASGVRTTWLGMGNGVHLPAYQIFTPPEQSERALELIGGFLGTLGMLGELSPQELEAVALEPGPESESER